MKHPITAILAAIILFCGLNLTAQHKVHSKDLVGKWKLNIDISKELEDAEEEAKEEDSFFAEMIVKSVGGMVEGILSNIDIYMEFQSDGKVKVSIDAFGEKETEYAEWSIDKNGRLRITETDNFSTNDDDYWLIDGDKLVLFEDNHEKEENVYLIKVK